jgi:hypothetical protein
MTNQEFLKNGTHVIPNKSYFAACYPPCLDDKSAKTKNNPVLINDDNYKESSSGGKTVLSRDGKLFVMTG